ncbi:transporter substrate-binding domain-containing protein [Pseudomonas sp. TWR2-1-1]|uniref:transporter substrate-binding domain-containing protein n=1 Tax=Pseudomonas sp. TWR2-1-1 TaxID=2804610 RepID=UPI003CE79B2F
MRRLMLLGMALLISCRAYADSPYAFTEAEKQWMHEHPVVRYAIDSYWPLEYIENGEHKGLTRDYLREISQISGLQFERVPTQNWKQTLDLIAEGKIDLTTAVSKALIDKDQARKLLLSDVFFVGSTIVVTRTGEPVLFSPHKLNGKVVAVKGGGGYEHYLRKEFPEVKLLLINDPEDALQALAEGDADAAIGMDSVLQMIISRKFFGTLHMSGVLSDMPIVSSMGVSPKSPELLSIINKSLARLPPSTIDEIFDRWLDRTDYGAPSWGMIFRYYQIELICFALLLSALAFMTRRAMLAQKAAQKSEAAKSSFLAMMSHEIRTPMNVNWPNDFGHFNRAL